MEELIQVVSKKTGLTPEKSKIAIDLVINFLKKKLPAPVAGQIDTVLALGSAPDLAKGLGGLLKKK